MKEVEDLSMQQAAQIEYLQRELDERDGDIWRKSRDGPRCLSDNCKMPALTLFRCLTRKRLDREERRRRYERRLWKTPIKSLQNSG